MRLSALRSPRCGEVEQRQDRRTRRREKQERKRACGALALARAFAQTGGFFSARLRYHPGVPFAEKEIVPW